MRPHRIGWQAEALEPSSRMQSRQLEVGVGGRRPVGAERRRRRPRPRWTCTGASCESTLLVPQVALGELVDRVVVLGQQLAGDVERDRSSGRARRGSPAARGDVVERLVPRRRRGSAASRPRAAGGLSARSADRDGLRQRQRLAARQPAVDRMLLVAAHGMQAPVANLRDEPAADAAVRAPGLDHHTGASAVRAPAAAPHRAQHADADERGERDERRRASARRRSRPCCRAARRARSAAGSRRGRRPRRRGR